MWAGSGHGHPAEDLGGKDRRLEHRGERMAKVLIRRGPEVVKEHSRMGTEELSGMPGRMP